MNITSNYNFYSYNIPLSQTNKSFYGASDINLRYIKKNHFDNLPERMQNAINERIKNNDDDISLRDLHLQEYKGLLECKTLDEARNKYPEFREVLPFEGVFARGSKNTRKIAEKVALEDLPLYLLQKRWGELENIQTIIETFDLRGRGSIGWIMEKLQIPMFPKNYQCLLNASDETRNNIIAEKTKAYNRAHPDWVQERNRKLSQDPKNIELNRELSTGMWARMRLAQMDMQLHRATHPDMNFSEFDQTFWDSHPEHKQSMSEIRREIAEERRQHRKNNKK